MNKTELIIKKLNLNPHPEGGYYRETYRSKDIIPGNNPEAKYKGDRNISTCIYYLLTAETFSSFHRIRQDEIWHFYDGNAICLHMISPTGDYSHVLIGTDIENNQIPQFVVPAGYWFAAKVETDYALVGCTVSPGFDFSDFELAKREELINRFPQLSDIITPLTR